MSPEKPINWKPWASAPVLLWEGVALVVGIDPRRLRISSDNWTAPGGRSPIFERSSFPSPEVRARFNDALAHADRATSYDGPIHVIDSHRGCSVSLQNLVEFFLACGWDGMPAGLVEAVRALDALPASPQDELAAVEPAPAVAASGTRKKWTNERLQELRAYRDKHGTTKAAEHFEMTTARVRALLPTEKPAVKGYSAFTHRPK